MLRHVLQRDRSRQSVVLSVSRFCTSLTKQDRSVRRSSTFAFDRLRTRPVRDPLTSSVRFRAVFRCCGGLRGHAASTSGLEDLCRTVSNALAVLVSGLGWNSGELWVNRGATGQTVWVGVLRSPVGIGGCQVASPVVCLQYKLFMPLWTCI